MPLNKETKPLHTVKWSNSFIWPIVRTLSGATIPGWSEPGSNGNEGVLHIPQSSRNGASSADGFMSYPGHSLRGVLTLLQRCSRRILPSQPNWRGSSPFQPSRKIIKSPNINKRSLIGDKKQQKIKWKSKTLIIMSLFHLGNLDNLKTREIR